MSKMSPMSPMSPVSHQCYNENISLRISSQQVQRQHPTRTKHINQTKQPNPKGRLPYEMDTCKKNSCTVPTKSQTADTDELTHTESVCSDSTILSSIQPPHFTFWGTAFALSHFRKPQKKALFD